MFFVINNDSCVKEGNCANTCRFCDKGPEGGKAMDFDPYMQGFVRDTVALPGAPEPEWMLDGIPRIVSDKPEDQCVDFVTGINSRFACEKACHEESPSSLTYGGVCFYNGYRDRGEIKSDADRGQYLENDAETLVTILILTCYALFLGLTVVKVFAIFRARAQSMINAVLDKDIDNEVSNGYMSLEEASKKMEERTMYANMMDRMDSDHNHHLDIQELIKAMETVGTFTYTSLNTEEVEKALHEIDSDGSGELEMSEFINWIDNPDDKLAVETKNSMMDLAQSRPAVDASEVTGHSDYALGDALRLQFIREQRKRQTKIDRLKQHNEKFKADGKGEKLKDGGVIVHDERLDYVNHRLNTDAEVREQLIVQSMEFETHNEPQFGNAALEMFGQFYAMARALAQRQVDYSGNSLNDGQIQSVVVVPFGAQGGDLIYLDNNANPMVQTQVYELTEQTVVTRDIDPQSIRTATLPVGTTVEALEERTFIGTADHSTHEDDGIESIVLGEDDGTSHHTVITRVRIVCKAQTLNALVPIAMMQQGWMTLTQKSVVRIDRLPMLSRMYIVPLMLTPGQPMNIPISEKKGWYRVVRQSFIGKSSQDLNRPKWLLRLLSRPEVYPGEVIHVVHHKNHNGQIHLNFDWRVRITDGHVVGNWEDRFNKAVFVALGVGIFLTGLATITGRLAVGGWDGHRCPDTRVSADDFCMSGVYFDPTDMTQCLSRAQCCKWDAHYAGCYSRIGSKSCPLADGDETNDMCQYSDAIISVGASVALLGIGFVLLVQWYYSTGQVRHNALPVGIHWTAMGSLAFGLLLGLATMLLSALANEPELLAVSAALAVSSIVGLKSAQKPRGAARSLSVLCAAFGAFITVFVIVNAKGTKYTVDYSGCFETPKPLQHLPEPATYSVNKDECAERCFHKLTDQLAHHRTNPDDYGSGGLIGRAYGGAGTEFIAKQYEVIGAVAKATSAMVCRVNNVPVSVAGTQTCKSAHGALLAVFLYAMQVLLPPLHLAAGRCSSQPERCPALAVYTTRTLSSMMKCALNFG